MGMQIMNTAGQLGAMSSASAGRRITLDFIKDHQKVTREFPMREPKDLVRLRAALKLKFDQVG